MGNKLTINTELNDKVSKKLGTIGTAFDKTFGKGSGASLFGNVGAKGVALGFNLIGDAISGTLGFLEDSVKAFNDDAQSQALFEQALRNNVPVLKLNQAAIDGYVSAQIERGFIDDDVRASLSQLVGITHDATRAQELNTLAEDLARAKHIDLATATDIVGKAALGNGKALKGLGIDIGKTKDAAGILDIVQQNVKGSADKWADTTSGKLQIAQDKFSEAQEKLGGVIMPVLADIMVKMTDEWIPAFSRGWDKVTTAIKGVVDWIGNMIGALNRGIDKVKEFLGLVDKTHNVGHLGKDSFAPGITPHAEGGWAGLHGPELAMLGERGPEYVRKAGTGTGDGGGGHGHPIIMDGRLVAEAVDERQYRLNRRVPATVRT